MKLLLDQNISYKVTRILADKFTEVKHVKQLGLYNAPDYKIWEYAKLHDFTVVTFDSDFIEMSQLKLSPPKIVWLKFGNSSNLKIANKLISAYQQIFDFNSSEVIHFLEIQ